jgi:hypothetical protein
MSHDQVKDPNQHSEQPGQGQQSGQNKKDPMDPSKKNPGQDNKHDQGQGDQNQDIRRRAS